MEINSSINYLSVLIAALASFVFGWLWYGPFFGKLWAFENKSRVNKDASMGSTMVKHFVLVLITVIAVEMLFVGSLAQGIALAFIVWVGFILTNRIGSTLWMKDSMTGAIIDVAYHLANLIIIVLVLHAL